MQTSQSQRATADWTRGAARMFAVVVVLLLVGVGVWMDRSSDPERSDWAGAGQSVSIADLTGGASRGSVVPGAEGATSGAIEGGVLDLNRATAAQLELLPGIGPASAARIVAYRDQIGGFRSVEELDGVSGIGARTLERLRPLVRVELGLHESGETSAGSDGR
jgi:competence ComEA-like helix-hairpin-helix protein